MTTTNISKSTVFNSYDSNFVTGIFGEGKRLFLETSQNFVAPKTGKYRVRVWGCGGSSYYDVKKKLLNVGSGGGFSMKEIELNEGDVVPVNVAVQSPQSSSFGAFLSATSGANRTSNNSVFGGNGIGGDINVTGHRSYVFSYASFDDALKKIKRFCGLSMKYSFLSGESFVKKNDIDAFEQFANVGFSGHGSLKGLGFVIVEY
ncbi:hypothetical protein [Marinomonas sp. 2405UD68-3]|uniref:hypothetical protein n=1 Tax=Marinomonas sp. 2405UD68-3 TaxID=3391835 RepID=UPI0039C8DAF5